MFGIDAAHGGWWFVLFVVLCELVWFIGLLWARRVVRQDRLDGRSTQQRRALRRVR